MGSVIVPDWLFSLELPQVDKWMYLCLVGCQREVTFQAPLLLGLIALRADLTETQARISLNTLRASELIRASYELKPDYQGSRKEWWTITICEREP